MLERQAGRVEPRLLRRRGPAAPAADDSAVHPAAVHPAGRAAAAVHSTANGASRLKRHIVFGELVACDCDEHQTSRQRSRGSVGVEVEIIVKTERSD